MFITSESVTEGHPDKMADQISDAILDEVLRRDPYGRVAVETLLTKNLAVIAGEVTTRHRFDAEKIARKVIKEIGYIDSAYGFDSKTSKVQVFLNQQSPDIAQGVSQYREEKPESVGAGDQGIMYGYATNETPALMPLPIFLAHNLTRRLAEVRKKGILKYLRPDGKAQVTIEYQNGRPRRAHTILISTQHAPEVKHEQIKKDVINKVVGAVLSKKLVDKNTRFLVNPTGRFVIGGPEGDTGLTGRKIIVDTYGGVASHGGGAFFGKDPTKVDRSAAYAARWVAKNIIAAGLADKCEVQLSYCIGVAEPTSVNVDCLGTNKAGEDRIVAAVRKHFKLTPRWIIETL